MNWFTVGQLLNRTWYAQKVLIKDGKDEVLFDGENYKLFRDSTSNLLDRWVSTMGTYDGKLIVVVK